jgi:hypothetical protein
MRNQIIAAALAAVTPLALAAPASAAPGNGAERYSFSECFSADPGEPPFDVCLFVQGRLKVTETRSGNFHVTDHSTVTVNVTSEDFTGSGTSRSKFKLLLKQGREHVVHDRVRFSSTFEGVTCSGSFRSKVVRGEVKKELFSESCDGESPEPEPES